MVSKTVTKFKKGCYVYKTNQSIEVKFSKNTFAAANRILLEEQFYRASSFDYTAKVTFGMFAMFYRLYFHIVQQHTDSWCLCVMCLCCVMRILQV